MSSNMDSNSSLLLKQIYEEMSSERQQLKSQMQDNNMRIREIELYLQSLFEKEDADYGVFSPRNVQSVHKEEISAQNEEKENLLNQNIELTGKMDVLTWRLDKLSQVLSTLNQSKGKVIDEDKSVRSDLDIYSEYNCNCDSNVKYLILDMQEKERQRIARDLHDNTVQNLTHLVHKIELSTKFMEQDTIRARMELLDVNRNIKVIIDDMRNIIFNLRPMEFDDIGLRTTIERYCMEMQLKTKIEISYNLEDISVKDQLVAISIYNIVKECVNNAIKYSNASNLNIDIEEKDSNVTILVEDNGVGFDTSKKIEERHFGLSLIKENISVLRGSISIESAIGKGTKILISIPNTEGGKV